MIEAHQRKRQWSGQLQGRLLEFENEAGNGWKTLAGDYSGLKG